MIRASSTLAVTALLVSGALHLSGVSLLSRAEDVQIEGGSPGNVARLGNSFQDVATGVQAPATPTETQVPEETQTQADRAEPSPQVDRDVPDEAQAAQSTVSATPPLPPTATALTPTSPTPTSTPLMPTAPTPTPTPLTPTALTPSPLTATTLMPAAPQVVAALEPNPSSPQPASQTALTPVPPETISPPPQPDTLEALDAPPAPEASPSASLRPKPRPKPPKRTARAPVTPPAATPSRGQSQPSQRAGRSDGQRDAVQTETTDSTKRAAQAGNADVSNYPGKVQRKISKVRRPRLSGSGTAEVVFRIAASGGLADLRIARSSGNARMDQEALSIIQRAAPFPKPPAGARVTYRVPVNWR